MIKGEFIQVSEQQWVLAVTSIVGGVVDGKFVLAVLTGPGSFVFDLFPRAITMLDRATWQPQETTIGVKPLFYANRDPRQITVDEIYLDASDTNQSLTPEIKALQALMEETERGTPRPLNAYWGDRQERCVLVELNIEEVFHTREGNPIRAKVRLGLMQLQEAGERTSSRAVEDADTGDGPEP